MMLDTLRSLWVWFAVALLIVVWLPLLAAVRLTDRDPVRYRTGRWFRRLGMAICRVNPSWKIQLRGQEGVTHPRKPYVVVSNHQSFADIPILSNLPWEMKWVAKKVLFTLPFVGSMMKLAGDIPVDRADARSGARTILSALKYLESRCSVMFFPEGTRSPDGRVYRFTDGAFHLAIRAQVPILPVAVEGSHGCLPRRTWRFGKPSTIHVHVLPEVATAGMTASDVGKLNATVRHMIIREVASVRGTTEEAVDALATEAPAATLS